MAHPAYNNIDIDTATLENTRGAKLLRMPVVGSLLSKGLTSLTLWGLQKEAGKEKSKLKPLKRAENIEKMFLQDARLRNNLRSAYPSLNDTSTNMYWSRSQERRDLHKFTEELTRIKVSNLTLARYITRKNDEFLTLKYFVEPDPSANNNNNAQRELYESFQRVRDDLLSKKLITETFTENDFVELLNKYYNPSEWLTNAYPPPVRLSLRKLIPMEYVHFLVTLEEIKQTTKDSTDEEFKAAFREKLTKSLSHGKVKDDVARRVLSLIQHLRLPDIKNKEIPYSLLFGGRPTHIANNMEGMPYLHHAMYLTGNIVLEQFAQLSPIEEKPQSFSIYINMKYMPDYLKAVRNQNASIFVIPYRNPYPDEALRRRALWTLGKYPMYDLATQNCESVPSWVFENNTAEPSICRIPLFTEAPLSTSSGLQKFWNEIVTQPGFATIPQFQRGGKTRKQSRREKKTRRTKSY